LRSDGDKKAAGVSPPFCVAVLPQHSPRCSANAQSIGRIRMRQSPPPRALRPGSWLNPGRSKAVRSTDEQIGHAAITGFASEMIASDHFDAARTALCRDLSKTSLQRLTFLRRNVECAHTNELLRSRTKEDRELMLPV